MRDITPISNNVCTSSQVEHPMHRARREAKSLIYHARGRADNARRLIAGEPGGRPSDHVGAIVELAGAVNTLTDAIEHLLTATDDTLPERPTAPSKGGA